MSALEDNKIIIEGLTEDGAKFRPSDWAERMCGALCTFRGRRIHYDPRLMPFRSAEGHKCVSLDPALKTDNPALYDSIIEFAEKNHLRMHYNEVGNADENTDLEITE